MAEGSKAMERVEHFEGVHDTSAVPDAVKVQGGLLIDAGNKNEHHLKVAKDGRVRSFLLRNTSPFFDHKLTDNHLRQFSYRNHLMIRMIL
jgi:hypothetical protein